MLVADEFFLIAHNDSRGKAKLHPSATGLGLAAGLLAELILFGQITVSGGLVTVLDRRPPADALAHTVLDQLIGESQHQAVRTWLAFLSQSSTTSVGSGWPAPGCCAGRRTAGCCGPRSATCRSTSTPPPGRRPGCVPWSSGRSSPWCRTPPCSGWWPRPG